MAHYRTTVASTASSDQAFDLIGNFARIAEWDPGVSESKRLDSGPLGVGSTFEVITVMGPRKLPLTYEVLEFTAGERIVLQAQTSDFVSYDVITVEATPEGSELTYDADLAMKGYRRIFDLGLTALFQVIGRRAEAGMRRELARQG